MINGNPNDFLNTVHSCQDIVFVYHGIKYWFQGYMQENSVHMEIFQYFPTSEKYIWEYNGNSIQQCFDAFLEAPIFGGKTFWDAESKIEWVDD